MQVISYSLEDYRKANGEYPRNYRDALPEEHRRFWSDGFGYPLVYESRPDAFIIVSLGRDGRSDGTDYWELRQVGTQMRDVRGQFAADQVLSDRGWIQEACK
jgi:hypothetical protein